MSTAPPIEPAPAGLASNRGCLRGALFGCGGAAVLLVAALVGLGIYVQKRPATVTDFLMDQVRGSFAPEVTEQDKADLEAAYADFRAALEERRLRQQDLERVRDTVKLGREVSRAEVHELTRVFREAVGAGRRKTGDGTQTTVPPATPVP